MKSFFLTVAGLLIYSSGYSQNVGIGITTPLTSLHIQNGASGAIPFAFSPLAVESNGHTYINLLSPAVNETAILFGKAGNSASGVLMYNNSSTLNGFQFRVNGNVTKMVLDNTGNLGIGTISPGFPLNFAPLLGDKISLFGNSGAHYGFGIQNYLMQIYTDGATADIAFGYGSSSSFTERMRIVNAYGTGMELKGTIVLKNGTSPLDPYYGPGIWLFKADNSDLLGFMGTQNNQNIGFYGGPAGWGLTYDAINSRVGIGTASPDYPLEVRGDADWTGSFWNTRASGYGIGVTGISLSVEGVGVGGSGGDIGVYGEGTNSGGWFSGDIGVYGQGYNWGGWFSGDVYTTGEYQSSDRKLKNDIASLRGALSILSQLNPSVYTYKTNEYKQMHLPQGIHYGLIADEVKQVLPGAVKKAVQPPQYENLNEHDGKKLSDKVEFDAVNYIEMIPILIAAVKEQQVMIEELKMKNQLIEQQQDQIDELKKLVAELMAKKDGEGMLSVNYSGLIPVTIESIKEQQKQMDALQKHDALQQQQIDELKKLVQDLSAKL